MGAVEVVVLDVLDEHGAEVTLVDEDHMIQALSADRANEPFGDGIRARRPEGCSDAGDPQPG